MTWRYASYVTVKAGANRIHELTNFGYVTMKDTKAFPDGFHRFEIAYDLGDTKIGAP